MNDIERRLLKHVTFCSQGSHKIFQSGRQAELDTVQLLVDNMSTSSYGNFHILVNYTMPIRTSGASGMLEIDVLVINRFGVFTLEVKDWRGIIEAFDDQWLQNERYKHENVFVSTEYKARVLSGKLKPTPVYGLIVLARGLQNFINHSRYDDNMVIGMDPISLRRAVGNGHRKTSLTDGQIQEIKDQLFQEHQTPGETLVRDYRIVGPISPGNLFDAFEGVDVNLEGHRVRVKRFTIKRLPEVNSDMIKRFKQSAIAVHKMGSHTNILGSISFFEDSDRPDTFYEITEYPQGDRLDEIIGRLDEPVPFPYQLKVIGPLCAALAHAHRHKVYHRNVNPEVVYISNENIVKLADFDYAKILGRSTIYDPNHPWISTPMTAPEVNLNPSSASPASDIYSLGVLWYFLVCMPEKNPNIDLNRINHLQIPPDARRIMKHMLTRAVKSRPQDIQEVLAVLRDLQEQVE